MDDEILAYKEMVIKRKEEVPLWGRKWLTVEEAAAYSGIGRTKLRELANKDECSFAIRMNNKIHIIRERLDSFVETQSRI